MKFIVLFSSEQHNFPLVNSHDLPAPLPSLVARTSKICGLAHGAAHSPGVSQLSYEEKSSLATTMYVSIGSL